jgi:histidine ammonia-lyase
MVIIGGRLITSDDFNKILIEGEKIELDDNALAEVSENYAFLKVFASDKIIYGINTGLGPMSQYKVAEKDRLQLQYNLIRSHASGCGDRLTDIDTKSLMVARLNTLMKGYSGIHPEVPALLKNLINLDLYPIIPQHGGVGASGDLVQLAHLALALIGEGEIIDNGEVLPASAVFRNHGLKPISMHIREALALINGTSAMSGIGMLNILRSRRLLDWSVIASAFINEIVESFDDHYSVQLNQVKLHDGQREITNKLQKILKDSSLVRKREDHLFNGNNGETVFSSKIQEYYSIRCLTQILGPVIDTIHYAEKVVLNEINSVNDNPVIDHYNKNVYHGGNFHGDYVALEMDKLKLAITKLSMLTERQLNFLMNDKLNNKLPPFVNLGVLGLNLGMQGVQFTATSTVAENQTLSNPMYIHSIPTNNDNQDIVSMGTNAALITRKIIDNTFDVMAIQLLALIQAVDYLEIPGKLSSYTHSKYSQLRAIVPKFTEDLVKYPDIRNIRDFIIKNNPDL